MDVVVLSAPVFFEPPAINLSRAAFDRKRKKASEELIEEAANRTVKYAPGNNCVPANNSILTIWELILIDIIMHNR